MKVHILTCIGNEGTRILGVFAHESLAVKDACDLANGLYTKPGQPRAKSLAAADQLMGGGDENFEIEEHEVKDFKPAK